MLTTTTIRLLQPDDLDAAVSVLNREPVNNVIVASRLRVAGLDSRLLGGKMWGWYSGGTLRSLCYAGTNLVPICAGPTAVAAFADLARRNGRNNVSTIVGPAGPTARLWSLLEASWGPPRELRRHQPLMVTDSVPGGVRPDPLVRRVRRDEIDALMPACVAMFTEEVGVSPLAGGGGLHYQARMAELVSTGMVFARFEGGRVIFKAEIGAVTDRVCQLQGVWVTPERRGQGLSVPALATVLRCALRDVAPAVSLYVNDYNRAARAAYRRVGFTEVGAFMSVLF